MMRIKQMVQSIGDSGLGRQERLFRLLVMIGISGLAIASILGFLIGEDIGNVIVMLVALAIFSGVSYCTIHYHKIQIGAVIVAIVIVYFLMPFNFLTTGGIYGGAPIWLLFSMTYVCLVVEGKSKYVFLVSGGALSIVCYYIAYYHPEFMIEHTLETAYMDSLISLIVVATLTSVMILFQNAIYRSENEVSKKQQKEIEELNQMQNRFFSSMSHEIRTPINTIIGLNEMILREDVSDEVAADAKSIQGASKMLLALINDILDMSKIESGKMDIVPIAYQTGDMLSDIVNMIWVRAKNKGLEFHIDVDQTMPSQLYGDEVRIKQILINLLNNAVKYTSEGSVTLSIQCKKIKNGKAQVTYSVTDTGMGIKKESLPYLFRAFKRVDEEKNRYIEGTGLGLSIVKELVDLMGGEIAVNSVYTKGSTFVVTLPQEVVSEVEIGDLNLEERHVLNGREHYKQTFEAPNAHILIVDDSEMNLMVEEKLLRDTKAQIDTAQSGEECLKKTLQNRYDIILMDHLMPGMDGIECLHAIRTQTGGLNQNIPVVILTANAGSENQELYRRAGFDGYLLKPITGLQLETELIKHLPRELVNITSTVVNNGIDEAPVLAHNKKRLLMISTESVCDLPKQMLEKYQIAVIPYRVVTEGGEFLDGLETETEGVLSYIAEKGKRVKSEEPRMEAYEEFFAEQLTKAQYVIHIAMAKNGGHGYEQALEASKSFDNVYVLDSGHLSSGMGLMVLRAAEYVEEGKNADAIIKEMEQLKNKINTSFLVNDTEYLMRAGRLSEKIHSLCKALLLHPVIMLKNSSMTVAAIRIGTRDHVWKRYILSTLSNMQKVEQKILFITYSGLTKGELLEVERQVKEIASFETIVLQKASPAISANCGPGSFGLLFYKK